MALPPNYLIGILKSAVKQRAYFEKLKKMKAGTFGGRFTNKDYPGILNVKRGTKKGKPKLRIV
jgi:hypothetical protein